MVFAPRFSPDGSKVAFSVERGGNTDIYVMNLRSRDLDAAHHRPVDRHLAVVLAGRRRRSSSTPTAAARPQLYVMSADGSGARRISFGAGRYTTPVWSPTGDFIAFTKQTGGQFHIGVMRADGSDERILTTSYLDEGPTWAPNGRVLMFSPGNARRRLALWTVDISGRIVRPAPYPSAASDPAWSPLLN